MECWCNCVVMLVISLSAMLARPDAALYHPHTYFISSQRDKDCRQRKLKSLLTKPLTKCMVRTTLAPMRLWGEQTTFEIPCSPLCPTSSINVCSTDKPALRPMPSSRKLPQPWRMASMTSMAPRREGWVSLSFWWNALICAWKTYLSGIIKC